MLNKHARELHSFLKFLIYAFLVNIIYTARSEKLKFTLEIPFKLEIKPGISISFYAIHSSWRQALFINFYEWFIVLIHWRLLKVHSLNCCGHPFQLAITVWNMYQSCIPLWPYCPPTFALPSVFDDIGTRRRHPLIWWMLPNMRHRFLWWSLRTNFTLQRVSEAGVRVCLCACVGVWLCVGVFVKT